MKLKLRIYGCLCATEEFKINNIKADEEDFGFTMDKDEESAEDYACGNMQFTPIEVTKEVLKKYKITEKEYDDICKKLKKGLSFGACGWCV